MKQLIQSQDTTLAVALGRRGFLCQEETWTELDLSGLRNSDTTDTTIQAMGLHQNLQAVALRNKRLGIFQRGKLIANTITEKRITALRFTIFDGMDILLATDMVGDLTAYKIQPDTTTATEPPLQRTVLLGHTASVLTDLCLINHSYILTADRDEKIRVSHYSKPHEIHGYLLSHTAFVSSMCQIDDHHIASISGDGRLIVWNVDTISEETSCAIAHDTTIVPTKVLYMKTAQLLVILCDQDCTLYTVAYENGTLTTPNEHQFSFPSVPIDMCQHAPDETIAVLFRQAPFVRYYSPNNAWHETTPEELTKGLSQLVRNDDTIEIPTSRLEHSCMAKHGITPRRTVNNIARLPKQKERIQERRQQKRHKKET